MHPPSRSYRHGHWRGLWVTLSLLAGTGHAWGQERYDDHELRDRFKISFGGFQTNNTSSKLRIDSSSLGLGAILRLEDDLNVEDSASVFRLDGFYRFNRAHRIEWTSFSVTRNGSNAFLDKQIEIGNVVIPIGFGVDTQWKLNINKIGYSYSFVNVEKYEMFVGGGLNSRDLSASLVGTGLLSGEVRTFDESSPLLLPTLTAGIRYNILDNLAAKFRFESFFLDTANTTGRMQDTYVLLEYDIGRNFGIGGGVNAYNLDVENDKDNPWEVASSYVGLLVYLTASF